MTRSTRYSYQSMEDILSALEEWRKRFIQVLEMLTSSRKKLQEIAYWEKNISSSFKSVIERSIKLFDTSRQEVTAILEEIRSEVEPHHVTRLESLANAASQLDDRIGWVWHNEFVDKKYGETNFFVVERMYAEASNTAADMLDLSSLSMRLKDFVGKKNPSRADFDLNLIGSALWVLEGDETQGTAFMLSGVGLVTCQHVLGPNMYAFKSNDVTKTYPVTVLHQNRDIDLAILNIDAPITGELHRGTADDVKQMDAIAVAGHPKYRKGDTFVIHPGLVSGFRMVSGIRRLLVNASIVAGNSGGPVVNRNNQVIGVAVTGSDSMESAQDTENHGVIPIDALQFLKRD